MLNKRNAAIIGRITNKMKVCSHTYIHTYIYMYVHMYKYCWPFASALMHWTCVHYFY